MTPLVHLQVGVLVDSGVVDLHPEHLDLATIAALRQQLKVSHHRHTDSQAAGDR